uniref:Uncharacterized protein n=1 Tax=Equus asinus TaxID=9793 RepID=A0A9L0J9F5_EQUAS
LNSRIPLVRTSSKSAARRRPRRGAARNRGPGADPAGGTGAPDRRAAARPGARGRARRARAAARPGRAGRTRRDRDRDRARARATPGAPRRREDAARRGAAPAGPAGLPGAGRDARRSSWGDPREGPGSRPESPPPPAPRVPGRSPRGGNAPPAGGPRPRRRPSAAPPPPRGPPPLRPGEGRNGGGRGEESGRRGAARGGGGAGAGPRGRPRAWGGRRRLSSSRGARPAPLRAPARPTQPLEPILIPKLRIRLADFPYLHCSNMPEAVHLGDLLRIWVRPGARFTPSPPDFQGPARAHRTPPEPRRFPRHGPLSRGEPIPGRPALHKEKRELSPGLPPASPGSVALPHWTPRGAHLRHSGFGDLNPTPFRSAEGNGGHRPSLRNGARPSLRTD